MSDALELLRANLPVLASLCMMQIFPFVLYAMVSERVSLWDKACAACAYAAFGSLLAWSGEQPLMTAVSHCVAFGYSTLGALCVWLVGSRIKQGSKLPSAALFFGLCVLFICIPGRLLPEPANIVSVVWGFELAFSSYSYLHDGWTLGKRPPLEQGLFFLLINPVLCYPERGTVLEPTHARAAGAARCLLGVVALGFHVALIAVLFRLPQPGPPGAGSLVSAQSTFAFVAHYGARFVAGYARHSGGASLCIGAMHLLGFQIPERYDHPWRATSPADFWRRWNLYLGSWARRYLFVPWAGRLQRTLRARKGGSAFAKAAAVLGTFGLIGFLHDLAVFSQSRRWPFGGTLVFGLNGAALLVWVAAGQLTKHTGGWRAPAWLAPASSGLLSRMFFVPFLLGVVWIAIPTMSADFAIDLGDVMKWLASEPRAAR